MANKPRLPLNIWVQILRFNQDESRVNQLEKILLTYSNYMAVNDTYNTMTKIYVKLLQSGSNNLWELCDDSDDEEDDDSDDSDDLDEDKYRKVEIKREKALEAVNYYGQKRKEAVNKINKLLRQYRRQYPSAKIK